MGGGLTGSCGRVQPIEKELLERLQKGVYQQSDIYNYPLEEYNKVVDMEKLQPAAEEDEEEDDIEDFDGFAIHESQGDDDDEYARSTDDEEAEAVDQRKAKRKTTLASKKLERDALDSKSKKARVLVEKNIKGNQQLLNLKSS